MGDKHVGTNVGASLNASASAGHFGRSAGATGPRVGMGRGGYGGGYGGGGGGAAGAGGPASGAIMVTFERIGDAAATCTRMVGIMESEFDKLQGALNHIRQTWTGDARERYEELQRRWDTSHENLKQILITIASALVQAQQNYLATERANANIWAG